MIPDRSFTFMMDELQEFIWEVDEKLHIHACNYQQKIEASLFLRCFTSQVRASHC